MSYCARAMAVAGVGAPSRHRTSAPVRNPARICSRGLPTDTGDAHAPTARRGHGRHAKKRIASDPEDEGSIAAGAMDEDEDADFVGTGHRGASDDEMDDFQQTNVAAPKRKHSATGGGLPQSPSKRRRSNGALPACAQSGQRVGAWRGMARVGQHFDSREALCASGVHPSKSHAVCGNEIAGAFSLLLLRSRCLVDNGGAFEFYEPVSDAVGGSEAAEPRRPKLWLTVSHVRDQAVRVVRQVVLLTARGQAPSAQRRDGFRYDGLFKVTRHWEGTGPEGQPRHCFRLEACEGSDRSVKDAGRQGRDVARQLGDDECEDGTAWLRRVRRASTRRSFVPPSVLPSHGYASRARFWSLDGERVTYEGPARPAPARHRGQRQASSTRRDQGGGGRRGGGGSSGGGSGGSGGSGGGSSGGGGSGGSRRGGGDAEGRPAVDRATTSTSVNANSTGSPPFQSLPLSSSFLFSSSASSAASASSSTSSASAHAPLVSLRIAMEQMRPAKSPPHYAHASHRLYCHLCHETRELEIEGAPEPAKPMVRCSKCRLVYCVRCLRYLLSPRPALGVASDGAPTGSQGYGSQLSNAPSDVPSEGASNGHVATAGGQLLTGGTPAITDACSQVERFLREAPGRWTCFSCTSRCSCMVTRTAGHGDADARHRHAGWPNLTDRGPPPAPPQPAPIPPIGDEKGAMGMGGAGGTAGQQGGHAARASGSSGLRQGQLWGGIDASAQRRPRQVMGGVSIADTLERLRARCPAGLQSELRWGQPKNVAVPNDSDDERTESRAPPVAGSGLTGERPAVTRSAPVPASVGRRKPAKPRRLSRDVLQPPPPTLSPPQLPALAPGTRLVALTPTGLDAGGNGATGSAGGSSGGGSGDAAPSLHPILSSAGSTEVIESRRPLEDQLPLLFRQIRSRLAGLTRGMPAFDEPPSATARRLARPHST